MQSGFWVLSTILSVARACVLMGLDRSWSCGVSRKKTADSRSVATPPV